MRRPVLAAVAAGLAALVVRGDRLGARADQPGRVACERAAAVQPGRPDREGERDDDEDRAHRPDGLLDRLVRSESRLDTRRASRPARGQRRDPEGDLDGRKCADRGGLALPVPRAAGQEQARTPSRCSRPTRTARSSTGRAPSRRTAPAPTIEVMSSLGGGGRSTLAIVALVARGARPDRSAASRSSRGRGGKRQLADAPAAGATVAVVAARAGARAAGRGVRARLPDQDGPGRERRS